MKKFLGIVAAGLLVFGLAAQAQAAFTTDSELIRVMYDPTSGIEVATDIGSITALGTVTNDTSFDSISLSTLGATSWSQVSTAYFGISNTNAVEYMALSNSLTTAPTMVNTWSTWSALINSLLSVYSGTQATAIAGDPNSVSLPTSNSQSYYTALDAGGKGIGLYGGAFTTNLGAEVSNGTGGTQSLYEFVNPSKSRTTYTGTIVPTNFTIVTLDGTTDINPATAAPIPPSILLMGSGLLGLIGVGRRKLFA